MSSEVPSITLLKSTQVYTVGVTVEHRGRPYTVGVVVTAHTCAEWPKESGPILRADRYDSSMATIPPLVRSLLCKAATTALRTHLAAEQGFGAFVKNSGHIDMREVPNPNPSI